MDFDGFDCDAGNRAKCRKHGVALDETEFVIATTEIVSGDPAHSVQEQRFIAVGANRNGRLLFVAFTMRQRGTAKLVRPVSTRYMHKKEVSRYVKKESD